MGTLARARDEIASSEGYSDRRFKEWCEKFPALRETVFDGFEEGEEGAITFHFSDGYRLVVPAEVEPDEDKESWYDHWYATDKNDA